MATRKILSFNIVTDYTQAEETTLAGTLTGKPDGEAIIFNTTLGKVRIWDGAAFVTIDTDITYRNILECSGSHIAGRVAGTYGIGYGSAIAISGTGTLYPLATIYITAGDFQAINGLPPKLRIRAQIYVNDVAPTGNFTFGLFPVTRPSTSGGTGLVIYTIGTVVTGSNGATFTTPAADSILTAVSADFTVPANGHYIIGVVTTQTVATNSHVHLSSQLQLRNA